MADLKTYAMAFSLAATTVLSGCASSSQYQGGAQLNSASAQQQKSGWILSRDFKGLHAEACSVKDTWTTASNGHSAYCFDPADVKQLLNQDKISGEPMKQTGPQYGKMIWNSTMNNVYRNVDGRSQDNRVQFGSNGKGAINGMQAFMNNGYKGRCLESFMQNPNNPINGILYKTPKQLGTLDNCASELRMAETTHRMGPINIKIK